MIGYVLFFLFLIVGLQDLITHSFAFTALTGNPGGNIGTQRAVRKSELKLAAKKVSSINGVNYKYTLGYCHDTYVLSWVCVFDVWDGWDL